MPHVVDRLLIGQHPYYPTSLSLPGYAHPAIPFGVVLAVFFSGSALLFLACWLLSGTARHLKLNDRFIFCWFGLTGVIHLLVEGTVVAFPNFYKSTSKNVLFEIWKEYGQADSRYASRDPFTICMEAVTAYVEGPLCFVIMYGMLKQKPWRFTLQLAVSLGQLYGDVLYFATTCYSDRRTECWSHVSHCINHHKHRWDNFEAMCGTLPQLATQSGFMRQPRTAVWQCAVLCYTLLCSICNFAITFSAAVHHSSQEADPNDFNRIMSCSGNQNVAFMVVYVTPHMYHARLCASLPFLFDALPLHVACACLLDGVKAQKTPGLIHSRPEPLYFYFYFWFINSIWIVVPGLVICYSAGHINRCVAYANALKKFQ